jgi:hypothetical protein
LKVSVVVPIRDDPAGLSVALAGLAEQSRPPDEVILVNAGQGALTMSPAPLLEVRVVGAPGALPGEARNRGAAAASHPWVAFLDAGTRPVPGWLEAFHCALSRAPEARVLYGTYVPLLQDDWDWAAAAAYLAPASAPERGRHPTSASLLVERTVWEALGGMPKDLRAGEDLLFFREVATRGTAVAVVEEAIVRWQLPRGPLGHFRRLRRYSRATWPTALAATWQWPVLRMYAAGAAVVLAAALLQPLVAWVLLAAATLRVARNYRRRRFGLPGRLTLARLWRLGTLTLLADAATLLGVWDSLTRRGSAEG